MLRERERRKKEEERKKKRRRAASHIFHLEISIWKNPRDFILKCVSTTLIFHVFFFKFFLLFFLQPRDLFFSEKKARSHTENDA